MTSFWRQRRQSPLATQSSGHKPVSTSSSMKSSSRRISSLKKFKQKSIPSTQIFTRSSTREHAKPPPTATTTSASTTTPFNPCIPFVTVELLRLPKIAQSLGRRNNLEFEFGFEFKNSGVVKYCNLKFENTKISHGIRGMPLRFPCHTLSNLLQNNNPFQFPPGFQPPASQWYDTGSQPVKVFTQSTTNTTNNMNIMS